MKTYLLNSGLSLLQDQSNNVIDKIVFTGFEIGSGIGEVVDRNSTTVAGQLLYSGLPESMFITPIHTDEILISCEINKNVLEFRPGNILLRCNNNRAFLISISEYSMFKFQTTESSVGTKLIFNIIINIPGLMNRFDLSNLSRRLATFKEFATDLDVTRWAWEETVNQIFVNTDGRTNKPALVISSGRNYWSNPFIRNFDEIYETWGSKYPWLSVLPPEVLPTRQAYWLDSLFWTGWDEPILTDYEEYFDKTDGFLDANNNTIYEIECICGAIIIQAKSGITTGVYEVLWQLDDGTEDNCLKIYKDFDSSLKISITVSGNPFGNISLGTLSSNQLFKIGVAWVNNTISASMNGVNPVSLHDVPYTMFSYEREGVNSSVTNEWSGDKQSFARFHEEIPENILKLSTRI